MIVLKSLTWSNLFSYGENNTIIFDQEPLVQIVGLNGSGKSSIPLILEEVLFNKNSKGIKKGSVVNRLLDTNKYNATLLFTVFDEEYSLKVNRTGATQKVVLLKNGCDISSHTATDTFKQVETLLGLDQKSFSQYVYQSSTSSLQFLTATDTNRKKFLIDLLSLDKYVKAFETLKSIHKTVSDNLAKVKAKHDTVAGFIDKYNLVPLIDLPIKDLPNPVDKNLLDRLGVLKDTVSTIEGKNRAINNNNQYIKSRSLIKIEDLTSTEEIQDTTNIINLIAEIQAQIKHNNQLVAKHSKANGFCVTCGQSIPVSEAAAHLEEYKEDLANLKVELTALEASFKVIEVTYKNKQVAEFERLSALIDKSLPTEEYDKKSINEEILAINEVVQKYELSLAEITKYNNSAAAANAKTESIREQLIEFQKESSSLQSTISSLEKELSNFEVLKKVFSTNGLIAYKLENSVKGLEALANEYLEELSDGRFQLSFEINNDKLNVIITDNGIDIDIAALSAGELARVNTATLLAIRKLMSTISKSRLNLLFLDEVVDNLDLNGKEKLVEILLKEENLNTFLVSHGYSHPLLKRLNVIKDEEGISRLEDG